mmetsp:Transcript_37750/g.87347  ORF Transcript_37750/g.87347 Transcript_37750/m.87347 type:complete len:197 (+) Transcript_37750:23-613(+)
MESSMEREPMPDSRLECRLCLSSVLEDADGVEGQLCFPCNCTAPVHHGCLSRWQQVRRDQVLEQHHSVDEAQAHARTCEVCGARFLPHGARANPPVRSAICRVQGGTGKVALRRVPTLSRATRNFSDFSAGDGQQLEVIEQDVTGEFFRVRAMRAQRYRGEGTTAVAEGWIRHVYLDISHCALPSPRMPPAFVSGE